MAHEMLNIDWDEFVERFVPVKNHLDNDASMDGYMFETYGDEVAYVEKVNQVSPDCIWTVTDCDGCTFIGDGFHWVNRMGYIITENPVPPNTFVEVQDDPECDPEADNDEDDDFEDDDHVYENGNDHHPD